MDEAISDVLVSMHGISGGSGKQQLGPTIWTEVLFKGSPVKALVDTGSPATIVGLKFALKVLATNRRPGQSPQEWATYVQSRMQQPTVTLQNYNGGMLNVVADDGSAEQERQASSDFGVHPGGGTSRAATRYESTSFVGVSSPGASDGWSTSGHAFWKSISERAAR